MFRSKESSNRIEISRLVQDLLNFCVFGSLQLWGGGRWVGGVSGGIWRHGGVTTCMHMHINACIEIARPPTWRHPCLSCLTCMCVHVCMCECVCAYLCAWDTPLTPIPTTTPIYPSTTPPGGTLRISQNSITLELIKIFQFCLKIWNLWRILHPLMGGWFGGQVGGWVGWWVGSGQITKI